MKRLAIFFLITIFITSCSYVQHPKTLSQVKADLDCIRYEKGLDWKQISEKFGVPDIAPLPEPGTSLGNNSRIYKNTVTIFYTDLREIKEGEKVRFHEVVTNIEVCREK